MIVDYTKQMDLIKAYEVETPIHIIGAGSIGSWVCFFLLKMGFQNIHIYDTDTIEEHNLPNQFYREDDIGRKKTSALGGLYCDFFREEAKRLIIHDEWVTEDTRAFTGIIISAVDSMSARKEIFESHFALNPRVDLWIEARLSIYGAYIYSLTHKNESALESYRKTLYNDTETEVSACGISQTALPAAVNCASLIIMQLIEHLNGNDVLNFLEYSIPWLDVMKGEYK
jgi:hypothetical protein